MACAGIIPWARVFKLIKSAGRIFNAVSKAIKWEDRVSRVRALMTRWSAKVNDLVRKGMDKLNDLLPSKPTSCVKHSFPPGTRVVLADGSSKPIEQVELGDRVLAADPETGRTVARKVVATWVHDDEPERTEVTVDTDGAAGGETATLTGTDWHPVWEPKVEAWVPLGNLQAGSWLQTLSGTWVQATAVRKYHGAGKVHDLTIYGVHNYYVVAGAAPVLVHNCGEADDDLLDFADEALSMQPDVRPNVATKATSADGQHVRFAYATDTRSGALPPQTARAVANSGHHGGCGEVNCSALFERDGIPLKGATFQSVAIGGGGRGNSFSMEMHGVLLAPCPACQRFLPLIGGRG